MSSSSSPAICRRSWRGPIARAPTSFAVSPVPAIPDIVHRYCKRPAAHRQSIENLIADLGFRTVHFEQMSFEDQVRVSAGASAMIGVHGAGLSNLVFARPGALVIELAPVFAGEQGLRPWYYQLASCNGKSYVGFDLRRQAVLADMQCHLPLLLSR